MGTPRITTFSGDGHVILLDSGNSGATVIVLGQDGKPRQLSMVWSEKSKNTRIYATARLGNLSPFALIKKGSSLLLARLIPPERKPIIIEGLKLNFDLVKGLPIYFGIYGDTLVVTQGRNVWGLKNIDNGEKLTASPMRGIDFDEIVGCGVTSIGQRIGPCLFNIGDSYATFSDAQGRSLVIEHTSGEIIVKSRAHELMKKSPFSKTRSGDLSFP